MENLELRHKYRSEPRFQEFVNWLRDRVWSGGYSGKDLLGAAQLAVELAEEKRVQTPSHPTQTVSEAQR